MRDTVYIVFNRHNVDRMTKREPQLSRGEKMVEVVVTAPDSLWDPLPRMRCELAVNQEQAGADAPVVLDPSAWPSGKGDTAQLHLNRISAQLLERAINCNDENMRKLALESLVMCREAGIEVLINLPDGVEGESE